MLKPISRYAGSPDDSFCTEKSLMVKPCCLYEIDEDRPDMMLLRTKDYDSRFVSRSTTVKKRSGTAIAHLMILGSI